MRILRLGATGWRNLARLDLTPGARVTVLHGENGQGKTNVLEAIYFLATLRSFRTTQVSDLVAADLPAGTPARLVASVDHQGLERRLELEVAPGARVVRVDGKAVRGAAAILGAVSVVLFVPEDLLLPRAAPLARRRFLDFAVFNVERTYYREASTFQRVIKSRNALLRRPQVDSTLLDTYDEQLARAGARIVVRRRALADQLAPRMRELFATLHAPLSVELRYRSDDAVQAAQDEEEVAAALLAGLRGRRGLDLRRGFTGFGPQTDDLDIALGGRLAREHASQGQIRSLVLALKLAELQNVRARTGEAPVLLLDDVPSELDPRRRAYLFELVGTLDCQTVITVTEPALVPPLSDRLDFMVSGGRVAAVAAPAAEPQFRA